MQPYIPNRKPPMVAVRNPYLSINKGIVGDWMMWEGGGPTVEDLSGNGNTGTFGSNPSWVIGETGPALRCVGSTSGVSVGNKSVLCNMTKFTYVIKAKIEGNSSYCGLFDHTNGYSNNRIYGVSDGGMMADIYYGGVKHRVTSSAKIGTNTWGLFAYVYDGSNIIIYVNGVADAPVAETGTPDGGTTAITIGGCFQLGNVNVEYASIYPRALTASEIALLYREPFCRFRWTNIVQLASYVAVGGIPIFRRRRAG